VDRGAFELRLGKPSFGHLSGEGGRTLASAFRTQSSKPSESRTDRFR
jgi:hypothetical protein